VVVLGNAWVVLKAITTGLNKDVKKGLDDAAKDMDKSGAKAGENYGVNLWGSAEEEIKKSGDKVGAALEDAIDPDRRGNNVGGKLAKSILSGLGGALSGVARPLASPWWSVSQVESALSSALLEILL
jgi:hypothetical protein